MTNLNRTQLHGRWLTGVRLVWVIEFERAHLPHDEKNPAPEPSWAADSRWNRA